MIVMGNGTQIHQIVMNLCHNAIHAMKSGGPLRVAVATLDLPAARALSHGSLTEGAYVRVSVDDGGCGIDETTLAHIFEPFFTTKEVGRGTGLGLALVYTIVSDFGGAIDVKSVPGDGSTFAIYIPMADVPNVAVAVS
jgi:signal transduction histidine kinase